MFLSSQNQNAELLLYKAALTDLSSFLAYRKKKLKNAQQRLRYIKFIGLYIKYVISYQGHASNAI
jgi:hypothetical protein